MSQVRVHNFSVSWMGSAPAMGRAWTHRSGTRNPAARVVLPTRTFRAMQGQHDGSAGVDDAFASAWGPGVGAR